MLIDRGCYSQGAERGRRPPPGFTEHKKSARKRTFTSASQRRCGARGDARDSDRAGGGKGRCPVPQGRVAGCVKAAPRKDLRENPKILASSTDVLPGARSHI